MSPENTATAIGRANKVPVYPPSLQRVAIRAQQAGISICPPVENGLKAPGPSRPDKATRWAHLQKELATLYTIGKWYGPRAGIGFVCGKVSGNLECLDFDDPAIFDRFVEAAAAMGLGELLARIRDGYCSRTPSGGRHLLWRCEKVGGCTKLAMRAVAVEGKAEPELKTLIELKAEGGYVIEPPSGGTVHPSGLEYVMDSGAIETIETITPEERATMLALAKSFDERGPDEQAEGIARPKAAPRQDGSQLRPGDDFDERGTWEEALAGHFTPVHASAGRKVFWRRAGKTDGWSATTGFGDGPDLLFVFSSSTGLAVGKWYTKFQAFAKLHHAGDFKAAAKALAGLGYGEQRARTTRVKHNGVYVEIGGKNGHATNGKPHSDGGDGGSGQVGTKAIEASDQFAWTELGLAERFVHQHGRDVKFCHPWGKYLCWDGRRWKEDDRGRVRWIAKHTIRGLYPEAKTILDPEERQDFIKWALGCEKKKAFDAMLSLASFHEGIPITPAEMDADPWLLNVENGTIDLRTGALRSHRRVDGLTKLCPIVYDPAAGCPLWLETLARFLPDPALVRYWQRICGYAITGVIRDHILPIAYGTGSNGKSTILGTLLGVLGPDYAMKAPPDLLMTKESSVHPTELASLFGKRLVLGIETEDGHRLNETRVKELTGGDTITARRMREDFWSFEPTHKLILATNHKPAVKGTDHGIWRRLKLVPFTVAMPDALADKSMPERLRAEYPGILAWCVRGCLDWQGDGLAEPEAVQAATRNYRQDEDVLGGFIRERCAVHPEARIQAGDLYAAYKGWAETVGQGVLSLTRFGKAITERGFEKDGKKYIFYQGIRLRNGEEDDEREVHDL